MLLETNQNKFSNVIKIDQLENWFTQLDSSDQPYRCHKIPLTSYVGVILFITTVTTAS